MWLAALISFLCYCIATVLFYILLPSPIPKERDPKQYHGYYTTHVSLVHCIVTLILSMLPCGDVFVSCDKAVCLRLGFLWSKQRLLLLNGNCIGFSLYE